MSTIFLVCAALLFAAAPVAVAADPDLRLATLRTAWVEPVDALADDHPVAACLAERLPATVPMTLAPIRAEADVILRVTANLSNSAKRVLLGSLGGTPSATLEATLPHGTRLWPDVAKVRKGNGAIGLAADPKCGLANGLLQHLREAMRQARNAAKP